MTIYDTYITYLSLKKHFAEPKYDYFKYNGKVKASVDAFEKRSDKIFFKKISKHKDTINYILANVIDRKIGYAGDLVGEEAEECYTNWLRINESLTYNTISEIGELRESFTDKFRVQNGQHPELLKMRIRNKISLETFTILNEHLGFFSVWDRKISDDIIWPKHRDKSLKYCQFLDYDRNKVKKFLKKVVTEELNKDAA